MPKEPSKIGAATIAREQLAAHKRAVNKEIAGRDRKLGQIIHGLAHSERDGELPVGDVSTLTPDADGLIANPLQGL